MKTKYFWRSMYKWSWRCDKKEEAKDKGKLLKSAQGNWEYIRKHNYHYNETKIYQIEGFWKTTSQQFTSVRYENVSITAFHISKQESKQTNKVLKRKGAALKRSFSRQIGHMLTRYTISISRISVCEIREISERPRPPEIYLTGYIFWT